MSGNCWAEPRRNVNNEDIFPRKGGKCLLCRMLGGEKLVQYRARVQKGHHPNDQVPTGRQQKAKRHSRLDCRGQGGRKGEVGQLSVPETAVAYDGSLTRKWLGPASKMGSGWSSKTVRRTRVGTNQGPGRADAQEPKRDGKTANCGFLLGLWSWEDLAMQSYLHWASRRGRWEGSSFVHTPKTSSFLYVFTGLWTLTSHAPSGTDKV